MTNFRITLGDTLGEGHGASVLYDIQVPDRFNTADLLENYLDSCEVFDLDEQFESAVIPSVAMQPLIHAGLIVNGSSIYLSDDRSMYEMTPDGLLYVVMFLMGYDIPDFAWRVTPPPTLLLSDLGYGLFG
jgi:hypothetical protein